MGNEIVLGHLIRCYDNGSKTIDRYTVCFMDQWRHQSSYGCGGSNCKQCYGPKLYACLAMNGSPFHPQGFGQHSEALLGSHLGKRIPFSHLPDDCQQAVYQEWRKDLYV